MSTCLDLTDLRRRVAEEIDAELSRQRAVLAELGDDTTPLVDAVAALLHGGKRLRAAFCYAGYVAAGGRHEAAALRAATAMEFFQAGALLHDDVMDDSDVRRGAPSAHRTLASQHARLGWSGSSDRFGEAGAILAGDLCLVCSGEMFIGSGLPAEELTRATVHFDAMRTQLMGGQFLDVVTAARGWDHLDTPARVDQALRVIRYKSAKYSIEQPLLIGAAAGGADEEDLGYLSAYGLALGEAFQLRDDILGVYGDPGVTGKPAGDDLREGKATLLMAFALDRADAAQTTTLRQGWGRAGLDDTDVTAMREGIAATGAVERVEAEIERGRDEARQALERVRGLTDPGRATLIELIDEATARST